MTSWTYESQVKDLLKLAEYMDIDGLYIDKDENDNISRIILTEQNTYDEDLFESLMDLIYILKDKMVNCEIDLSDCSEDFQDEFIDEWQDRFEDDEYEDVKFKDIAFNRLRRNESFREKKLKLQRFAKTVGLEGFDLSGKYVGSSFKINKIKIKEEDDYYSYHKLKEFVDKLDDLMHLFVRGCEIDMTQCTEKFQNDFNRLWYHELDNYKERAMFKVINLQNQNQR